MGIEAAAALFSVLAVESSTQCAKAVSIKRAHESRQAGVALGGGAAAAGGRPAPPAQQQQQPDGLPLSVLVAAAKSLRTLSASVLPIGKSLVSAPATAGAAADRKAGSGGSGGAGVGEGARGSAEAATAVRLIRYMTLHCDK